MVHRGLVRCHDFKAGKIVDGCVRLEWALIPTKAEVTRRLKYADALDGNEQQAAAELVENLIVSSSIRSLLTAVSLHIPVWRHLRPICRHTHA